MPSDRADRLRAGPRLGAPGAMSETPYRNCGIGTMSATGAITVEKVDGEDLRQSDLLQFLRDAYGGAADQAAVDQAAVDRAAVDQAAVDRAAADEQSSTAALGTDLLQFLRDFSLTAPRPRLALVARNDYQPPRRVLLSQNRGRRRGHVAHSPFAGLGTQGTTRRPTPVPGRAGPCIPVRVPPYISVLPGLV